MRNGQCLNRRSLIFQLLILLAPFLLAAPVLAQTPEPTATPEPPVYVVQPGDTLYTIAQRFGSTVEAIVAANDIANPSLISVGQKLIIPINQPEPVPTPEPHPNRRFHRVRPGETLPGLAFRYGTTVWLLRETNDLPRTAPLRPGQELTIPPPTAPHRGVPAFPQVIARPLPVAQGQTLFLTISSTAEITVRAAFLGRDLVFVNEGEGAWTLVGVDALTPPGGYPLSLTITETVGGDRLTMQETLTVTKGDFSTYNVVIPADRRGLLDPAIVRAERRKVNAAFAGIGRKRLWQGAFDPPLRGELRITAPFGQRRSYNGGPVASYHSGCDLGADTGTPVYAPMTGTVVLAEPLQVRGNALILDHGWGLFTAFWHLSQIDVTVGQVVGKGQPVGLVGNTGLSTGPHLHWEMRVYGVPVDPWQWTRQWAMTNDR